MAQDERRVRSKPPAHRLMLLTVAEFRSAVEVNRNALLDQLQAATGRTGEEERDAWDRSLPAVARILAAPSLGPLHLYVQRQGNLALEYQLPAASSWCDLVLLGRGDTGAAAVIVELKHWVTRSDRPGPVEGLMDRSGTLVLHPSDQVRGYTEYCRRFHSAVQEVEADVRGCVLFTRDRWVDTYRQAPNARLVDDYPCFTTSEKDVAEAWPSFVAKTLTRPDVAFARKFVDGRYRQDRGFIRQIGAQLSAPGASPFELLDHQRRALALVRARMESTVFAPTSPRKQVIIIEGPPGSGKSVVAARVWASLVQDARLQEGDVVLTTTSTSQTSNWSGLLQSAVGSRAAAGIVKRAASYVPVSTVMMGRLRKRYGEDFADDAEAWRGNLELLRRLGEPFQDGARDDQYLVSIVDEAHALINPEEPAGRGQFGFTPTLGPLGYHIIRCSTVSIFLLDSAQGFRDRENTEVEQLREWAEELGADVGPSISLAGAQFRCAGSAEYVSWVEGVLAGESSAELSVLARRWRDAFRVELVDDPSVLEASLRKARSGRESVRLLASYARPWRTKKADRPHELTAKFMDFQERYVDADGRERIWAKCWNFVPKKGTDYTWFIQAPPGSRMHDDPLSEVGCPYVVRGFDFDHVGLLWLRDLVWRDGRWRAQPKEVHDSGLDRSKREALAERAHGAAHDALVRALSSAYRILLTRGMRSCLIWVEDDETREYLRACLG